MSSPSNRQEDPRPPTDTRRGRGQRPGTDTKRGILDAALELFAEQGYERTTIRGIAREANVDPALVHHYFGTKEDLFASCIRVPDEAAAVMAHLDSGELTPDDLLPLGLALWEDPQVRKRLTALLRVGFSEPGAQRRFASLLRAEVIARIARLIGGDDAELRAEMAFSHALGIAVMRHVFAVEPLASTDIETMLRLLSPAMDTYLGARSEGG